MHTIYQTLVQENNHNNAPWVGIIFIYILRWMEEVKCLLEPQLIRGGVSGSSDNPLASDSPHMQLISELLLVSGNDEPGFLFLLFFHKCC